MIYFWKQIQGLPVVIYLVKKYNAYPLWFICKKKIQGLPRCDLVLWKNIQGLPHVIYFWIKYKAYPLWFIFGNKYKGYPLWFILVKKYKAYPLWFMLCEKIQGLHLVIYIWKKNKAYPLKSHGGKPCSFSPKKITSLVFFPKVTMPCDLFFEKIQGFYEYS